MTFEIVDGCTSFAKRINGVEIREMSSQELLAISRRMLSALIGKFDPLLNGPSEEVNAYLGDKLTFELPELLIAVSSMLVPPECDETEEPCDTCGDYIFSRKWEFDA